MSLVPYYTAFFALGLIVGFGLALLMGYRHHLKKRKMGTRAMDASRKALQEEMEKFFTGFNSERNILGDLRRLNPERCKAFGHTIHDMSLSFWSNAVAGETGELCSIIKKWERGDKIPGPDFLESVGREGADIVIYLDLLFAKLGLKLETWIPRKFNEVSDLINSPIKL